MNLVIFSGRVGKDPEAKEGVGARFSVASSERYKDKKTGEWKEKVTWLTVQAWGKLGDFAMKHLRKGDRVLVQGKLNIYEYNNKNYTNLVAAMIEPGVYRKDGEAPAQKPLPETEAEDSQGDDDDIPF